jgi:hypothetical protein
MSLYYISYVLTPYFVTDYTRIVLQFHFFDVSIIFNYLFIYIIFFLFVCIEVKSLQHCGHLNPFPIVVIKWKI